MCVTRDAEGRVIKESHADGSSTEYDYNAAGLLTLQKEVTKDHVTLRQIAYTYDDAGNLTSENRSGVLRAVKDGATHVSIYPVGATMEDWYNAGSDSIWTQTLKSIVIRM